MGRRQPLGLNVRLRYVQDVSGLDERVRALHATWCVVAVDRDEHLQYVNEFAQKHPELGIIARVVDVNPDAPVVAGRCELEFGAPVPGVYRVRVERKTGLEVGYVTIEAV